MKRFVRTHFILPEIAGLVGGVTVALTRASTGVAYLIALGLLLVVLAVGLGPELFRKEREGL